MLLFYFIKEFFAVIHRVEDSFSCFCSNMNNHLLQHKYLVSYNILCTIQHFEPVFLVIYLAVFSRLFIISRRRDDDMNCFGALGNVHVKSKAVISNEKHLLECFSHNRPHNNWYIITESRKCL